jgi:palmitoyl-protein thioesterase
MCNILNWEQAHISQYKFSQTHLAPAGFWRVASNK